MTEPRWGRADTPAGRMARLGVADAQRLAERLADVPWWRDGLLEDVGEAADPGQPLRTALDLHEVAPEGIVAVAADERAWRRFALVSGVSQALAEHLVRHPEHLPILAEDSPPPGAVALREEFARVASDALAGRRAVPGRGAPGGARTPPPTPCAWPIGPPCCASPSPTWPTAPASR